MSKEASCFARDVQDGSVVVAKKSSNRMRSYGFDAQNGDYVSLMTEGIIDPTRVGAYGATRCGLDRRPLDHTISSVTAIGPVVKYSSDEFA
jgi:hypothetical protein